MSSSRASLTHTSTSRRTCRSPDSARARFPRRSSTSASDARAVLEHAVSEGLDTFYRQAVEANELRVLGRPSADVVEWPNEKDFSGDLLVEVEVDVRPDFELPALRGHHRRGRRRRGRRGRDRRGARPPARPLRHARDRRPSRRDRRLRRARPGRHDRRRRDRPRRGRLVRGRLGRAARGHRRGDRLAHRG